MPPKKELVKARKIRNDWKNLNSKDYQRLEKRGLKEQLRKFRKIYVAFPRPVVINDIYIGDDFYKRIQINEALLYAEERVPLNCFVMPKVYKTSILKYYSNRNKAIMMVRRRRTIKTPSEEIKFEIVDVSFENENFKKYLFIKKENYPFTYLLRFIGYATESSSEGIFKLKFFLEMEDIGKINYNVTCRVLSDNQKEIETLLENKDKKLEDRFFEKIIYRCFLKSKEIVQEEGLPFPEAEWLLEQIKIKDKEIL
ncbi:hypothetical protein LCGC14_1020150 [marine sediment metagenome]|uniref:Uncharacterized protein n=1 Tax=marine sediment metagenome TaxID=412755 RepID=A0A0F9QFU7_9ZZZZ